MWLLCLANLQILEEDEVETVENPFMGWEGWPPQGVVIVAIILGIIVEIAFCVGFWQFWCAFVWFCV